MNRTITPFNKRLDHTFRLSIGRKYQFHSFLNIKYFTVEEIHCLYKRLLCEHRGDKNLVLLIFESNIHQGSNIPSFTFSSKFAVNVYFFDNGIYTIQYGARIIFPNSGVTLNLFQCGKDLQRGVAKATQHTEVYKLVQHFVKV